MTLSVQTEKKYVTGSNECETDKNSNKKKQADSRVGRRRAIQILAEEDESLRSNPHL